MVKALGYMLSARAILLLTLAGAFVLGVKAMEVQTYFSIAVLVVWGAFAILPVVFLEFRKRT